MTSIAVAWSNWCVVETDANVCLCRQFQLREDLLGTDVLQGWVGIELSARMTADEYSALGFAEATRFIEDFTLQVAVTGDTTHEDMEYHWSAVTELFREQSLNYTEP